MLYDLPYFIYTLFFKVEFDETKTSVDELVKVITGLGYVVIG